MMSRVDGIVKVIWLVIGVVVLGWLAFVAAPREWRQWERQRAAAARRPDRPTPEPAVIVGEQATLDREGGIRRHGLRFGPILDPRMRVDQPRGESPQLREDDWLLIPVALETYRRPQEIPSPMDMVDDAMSHYTWKSGEIGGEYRQVGIQAVNIVFYRRDGRDERLLTDRPAWIQGVHFPHDPGRLFFYELAISDTNGDDRINSQDGLTLWSSRPDGTDFQLVWMPKGQVEPARFREPVSGDFFGTVMYDVDKDGQITEYDRPELFRLAIGDTVARSVVPREMVERLEGIVFGRAEPTSRN